MGAHRVKRTGPSERCRKKESTEAGRDAPLLIRCIFPVGWVSVSAGRLPRGCGIYATHSRSRGHVQVVLLVVACYANRTSRISEATAITMPAIS